MVFIKIIWKLNTINKIILRFQILIRQLWQLRTESLILWYDLSLCTIVKVLVGKVWSAKYIYFGWMVTEVAQLISMHIKGGEGQ